MRPKRSLSQNFLTNRRVAERIVAAAGLSGEETVLEIGPGTGVLTEILLAQAAHVVAVEKDDALFALLQEKFVDEITSGKLELLNADILDALAGGRLQVAGGKTDCLPGSVSSMPAFCFLPSAFCLIANIPYNITGAIIEKFLSADTPPTMMVLLVQKEVAERVVARDKKESLLSVSVKAYGTPTIVGLVPAGNFFPKPKVDSAILKIAGISKNLFEGLTSGTDRGKKWGLTPFARSAPTGVSRQKGSDPIYCTTERERAFFELVRAGFAHKRKLLTSNLREHTGRTTEELQKILTDLGPDPKVRAEDISLGEWSGLFSTLSHFAGKK